LGCAAVRISLHRFPSHSKFASTFGIRLFLTARKSRCVNVSAAEELSEDLSPAVARTADRPVIDAVGRFETEIAAKYLQRQ
jgi:hypothetical protein